ncbi:uncharacterized protein LOC119092145 [Pollicipes pollicipes]|uniref:uncharacterized protein LOC119092145 n=1 Tax=Pollicipes pollicipes TaxID=41117 RepID=UPI0018859A28|nr:uncharacterized protein LOC119092145 [Pollicipes pollicipes]
MTPHPVTGQHLIMPPGRRRSVSRTSRSAQPEEREGNQSLVSENARQAERNRRICCGLLILLATLVLVAICVGVLVTELKRKSASHRASTTDAEHLRTGAAIRPATWRHIATAIYRTSDTLPRSRPPRRPLRTALATSAGDGRPAAVSLASRQ